MKTENVFKTGEASWYRLGPLLSRNAVINIALGPRGDGKTFAAKELVIKNAIKKGDQFIYLRRYTTELRGRHSFFSDIAHLFPEWTFRVFGMEAQMRKKYTKKWQTIGYFVPLSKAQQYKSIPFPKVTYIIFDEFIIDRGAVRYLPGEVRALLDFYSTVDRNQDRTRIIMISNTVSIANQYFLAWNIVVNDETEWYVDPTGFLAVQFIKDHVFSEQVRQTRFGQFISETDYGSYAIDGQFLDNNDSLIRQKPSSAVYMATFETPSGTFSLWHEYAGDINYVCERRPKEEVVFVTVPELMDEGKKYVARSNRFMGMIRSSFAHGRLFFSSPQARLAFRDIVA